MASSSSSSSPEISAPPSTHTNSTSTQARLHEVLEDLSSRFILNLPDEELASLERVCFQVEQAHWYYEDFIREQDPSFPTMTLKKFSNHMFHACPLLSHWGDDHEQTFQSFMAYKTRVPVCGAIMLNETWDKCLLVKGWKATSAWSFPKGKINEQEPRHRCAVREVLEETGYDLDKQIVPEDVVELSIKEQSLSLFIVPNIPEDFSFKTRTRKEISKISWFKLADLPTWKRNKAVPGKFYLITPFIGPLKAFLRDRKPRDLPRRQLSNLNVHVEPGPHVSGEEDPSGAGYMNNDTYAQESSSQSSSADNGDPQTPSPQYSEPQVTMNEPSTISGAENGIQHALNLDAVDPHFARLLNSLSLSASAISVEQGVRKTETTILSDHARRSSASAAKGHSVTSSTSVSVKPTHPSRPSSAAPRSAQISPVPSQRKSAQSVANNNISPPGSASLSVTTQASGASEGSAATVSPRSSVTRRKSSVTADISPYLSRATAAPAIQKQVKYITMLENVAKESERMTPKLERQALSMNGPLPPYMSSNQSFQPPPSMPPPPVAYGNRGDSPVIYSSGQGVSTTLGYNAPPTQPPPFGTQPPDDPFTVRPRTSNNFRAVPYPPPPLPRDGMHEEHQRYIMSGAGPRRPTVHPNGTYQQSHQPFAPPMGVQHPFGSQQPYPPSRIPPVHPSQRVAPPNLLPPSQYTESVSLSGPAISPTFTLPPRTNPVNNAHLLSILNTPNMARAVPNVPSINNFGPR